MKNLKDKVAVVTGAGSGVGRSLALQFSKEGCRLALNDYDENALKETVQLLDRQESVIADCFDVSNYESFEAFAKKTLEVYDHQVDIVVNNAGVNLVRLNFEETTMEQFHWIMNINFWGVIYGSKLFLPALQKRQEASLVNLSSVQGFVGAPQQTAYTATKFAVRGFTESLRMELLNSNVTVCCVHPGGIKTNIIKNARGLDENMDAQERDKEIKSMTRIYMHTPEMAAKTIINGIKKKKERILIGAEAKAIEFAQRLFPVKYVNLSTKLIELSTKKY